MKKPEAETIQWRITHRLNKMTRANTEDIEFLKIWSRKLYKLALNLTKQCDELQEKLDKIRKITEKC